MSRQRTLHLRFGAAALAVALIGAASSLSAQWTRRDERFGPRGPWRGAVGRELPHFQREANGIDFGHAHLAETLLRTRDSEAVERARLEVLDFIFSWPRIKPDEAQIAPRFTRLAWEAQRAFDWAHLLHQSLYDLFAAGETMDKEAAYRSIMDDYLDKPEAITSHPLDHHGALWSFPESRSFKSAHPAFNSQIWAYHWLQGAAYDAQLRGGAAVQRGLLPRLIAHYHGYLRNPPQEWEFMPLMAETAPEFSRRFPEAAVVFDNLHMLHDNIDDVLSRPDLFPDSASRRRRILELLQLYLHRNHVPGDRRAEVHAPGQAGGGHGPDHGAGHPAGARPPSAADVLEGAPGRPAVHHPPHPGGAR
ncbi:MAG TPA: hypothetical protein VJV23_03570 [Candidatus Polarisedimenticolia bacterium]|nr:hypothetical protein [Candidatus Polarisedimenticolia bacterium]